MTLRVASWLQDPTGGGRMKAGTLPKTTGNLETCPNCGWVSFASSRRKTCEFCGGPRRPRWVA